MRKSIPHSRPSLSRLEEEAATQILRSGNIFTGDQVIALETELNALIGQPAAAVSSGVAALHLALLISGVQPGDEIATPTHVCPSVLYALNYVQAKPRLFDCEPLGYGVDSSSLLSALGSSKLLILVHSYGFPVNLPLTMPNVKVIDDCAHALGALSSGEILGLKSYLAVYSFFPTKMVASTGGGAVIGSHNLVERVKDLRTTHRADDRMTRYPYEMSDLSSVIVRVQLKKLKDFIKKRRRIAELYTEQLQGLPIELPDMSRSESAAWYRYIIQTSIPRAIMIREAEARGVSLGYGVMTPVHRLIGQDSNLFPNSEKAYNFSVSLPIYPELSSNEAVQICETIRKIIASSQTLN